MRTSIPAATPRHRQNTGIRARTAFTLIELLVVVAIIALLIAILLPALNSAREQSKSAVCKAHLNQIGVAFTTYQAENYGMVRPGTNYSVYASTTFSTLIRWNFSQIFDLNNPPATYNALGGWMTQRMNTVAALQCPSLLPDVAQDVPGISCAYQADGALGDGNNKGAVTNVYLDGSADTLAFAEAVRVNTNHTLVQAAGSYMDQPSNTHPTFHGRHLGKGNVLWCDGHVSGETPFIQTVGISNPADYTKFKIGYVTPVPPTASQTTFLLAGNKDYYFWADKNAQN